MKKKLLIPKTLLGRSLFIVFIPTITVVLVTTLVFYQTSWNIISKRLTQSVVADINVIIKLIDQNLEPIAFKIAKEDFRMNIKIEKNRNINLLSFKKQRGILSERLQQALEDLQKPFFYDLNNLDQGVKIVIQYNKDLLIINVHKDRLYSGSAFVFLLWMFFASVVLLLLAYFFMKGQIRPLKKLSIIAETFGRGLDAPELKESGSSEIRQTTNAFNQMRTRIKRFLKQRTDMLAGVSHDLRTPLTRMKLQLSLIKNEKTKTDLISDINEMTAMLDSYVSFVKGEIPDPIEIIFFHDFLKEICENIKDDQIDIKLNILKKIKSSGRPLQLRRCFINLIENSIRYSKKIEIKLDGNENNILITIEDDGPGIPQKNYEDVFKPFFTLDPSRNKLKGESGLGMTISRDIVRSHGGEISLKKSKFNGLKIDISLPV
ncbi:MAG: Osmolarity sensor protein EnvZ [Alphaproteobacteria bacterium MarineAlpha5_Bin9]|nr:MAG: Osmolarity sensor protein EnvZ [Alphaproteobacteria bacterium MarineAlpha5_Bin9]|tara:strand:+ start:530 stop:1825 length:1296 start_codon:yes stop_codon:yes gene_type:complete